MEPSLSSCHFYLVGALSVSLLFSWSSCSLTRNVRSTNPRVAQSTRCEDFWSLSLASGSVKEVAAFVQNRYRLFAYRVLTNRTNRTKIWHDQVVRLHGCTYMTLDRTIQNIIWCVETWETKQSIMYANMITPGQSLRQARSQHSYYKVLPLFIKECHEFV
jgi:hypothetical protein